MPRVIVVGAGPGGLAAAARLLERGGDAVDVTLIAPGGTATFLAGTLDVMLADAPPGSFSCAVAMSGVSLIDARVDAISPEGVVAVAGDRIRADAVIAAPGLQLRSREHVPPWPRAVSAWDPLAAAAARAAILGVAAGRVLVAACGLPYRCPPAPFALAVGLADRHLRARHQTRVTVATPEPMPLAGVGGEAPALIMDATAGAGVTVERGFVVELDHSEDGILRSADGRELRYDAAFLVPVHERSPCLAGLPGDGPLVPVGVSGRVGESRVFVVGDAAATGLPRAAGVARATATAAADAALAALGVCDAPEPAPIHASCFMFHHGGAVSRIRVTFRDGAGDVAIDGPSLDLLPARAGELRRFLESARGRVLSSAERGGTHARVSEPE